MAIWRGRLKRLTRVDDAISPTSMPKDCDTVDLMDATDGCPACHP
jgi:hypothetical protein